MMKEFEVLKENLKPVLNEKVFLGPGDDCSVIPFDENQYQVATTDCLVEGVHFLRNQISMDQLAYKVLAVNISDISAMGGFPYWCHLTLILPQDFSDQDAKVFFNSFYKVADQNNISLIGGNLSSTKSDIVVQVHLTGLVKKENLQLRSDFKKSQILCVTQNLGDSSAGLHSLSNKKNETLTKKHFYPPIETEKALWLASQKKVHGMMDLSDGLKSDLEHLLHVEVTIDLDKIPHSKELIQYCHTQNLDPFSFSTSGGEDYCLLFGCEKDGLVELQNSYEEKFNSQFHVIGEIKTGEKKINWIKNKKNIAIDNKSFKHFN